MTSTLSVSKTVENLDRGPLGRDEMAQAVAADIPPGSFVNLGIGQPTKVSDYLAPTAESSCTPRTACWAWGPRPSATRSTPI